MGLMLMSKWRLLMAFFFLGSFFILHDINLHYLRICSRYGEGKSGVGGAWFSTT
jgi:hypothetical protein